MMAAAFTGLLAYRTDNNLVFVVFSCLLGFLLVGRFAPWVMEKPVRLSRDVPQDIFAGRPVSIGLTARTTRGWLSSFAVTVHDLIDVPAFRIGPPPFFSRIPPRTEIEARYTLRFRRRGRYRGEAFDIECGFPFGLFSRRQRGHDPQEFIILPKPRSLKRHILPTESGMPAAGLDATPWLGEEEEFKCLRAYQPGDPLKQIHWKTTARHRKLMIRVMDNLEHRRVTVLLDTRSVPGRFRLRRSVSLERGVRVAASLAADLEKRGYGVRLGAFAPSLVLTPFGQGADHLRGILRLLAVLEPTPEGGPGELVREAFARAGHGHHYIVLLLSPSHAEEVRENTGGRGALSFRAFDVSHPGLPRVV
ncbi:MAG: DUF58 domain-containing protein [Planctomycetota bacterium]|jgi:uncharacterized protein (DUF58 family)